MNDTHSSTDPFSNITLVADNGASANIYRYGAHLNAWKTSEGRQWLFVSQKAKLEEGAAIRGGVPIIFPQFNAFGSGPRHGFARNMVWQLIGGEQSNSAQSECCFELRSNESTMTQWPHCFKAQFRVKLSADQITMTLSVINTGSEDFTFTCALHTYLALSIIDRVKLQGLQGLAFWDNDGSDFSKRGTDEGEELLISGAIDRVYFDVTSPLKLVDGNHMLHIAAEGFSDAVIWNPGEEAAKNMDDFEDSEYSKMLCVEAASIDRPVTLKPRENWYGSQILTAEYTGNMEC